MRIVFFTQEDPFYVKIFFDEFFAKFKTREEICAIVISRPMGKKSMKKLARQMYDFYGPFNFLRMGFRYGFKKLMSRLPISKPEDGRVPKTYSVKNVADAYGIPVLERSDLNSQGFRTFVKGYDPALFISVASPVIFKEELIGIPRLGCINIHNAPLPKYRGMLPNFWQMYHGEESVGITIHEINPKIDDGRIILQKHVAIEANETLDSLIKRTKRIGAASLFCVGGHNMWYIGSRRLKAALNV
jgi:methionyl-tRNA formyltransferase